MSLPFWALLALYFLCEAMLAGLLKSLSEPLRVLPVSVASGTACWCLYLLLTRQQERLRLTRDVVVAGAGSAVILLSATLAYSLRGVSILLPVFLMKLGGLTVAPAADVAQGRAPGRRALVVLLLAAAGVVAAAWSRVRVDGTAAALACAAAYVGGYALKLGPFGRHRGDWDFFAGATTVTLLVALPASVAAFLLAAPAGAAPLVASPAAWLAGAASQGCGVFGGLVLLRGASEADRARGLSSHTILFPLHRSTAILGAMAATAWRASWALGPGGAAASGFGFLPGELVGATCLLAALWVGAVRR